MYHSITFGAKNTWDDWHIVPSSRPVFDPPKVKKKTMDIPGGNGLLDLSEALTGYPVFGNREGSFEFIVMNDFNVWSELYSEISDYLHGRVLEAVLEDDPEYYYEGRFAVDKWKSDKNYSTISIGYSVSPYKRKVTDSEMELYAIPTSRVTTINSSFYGREPTCPTMTVASTSGLTHLRFINETLGIDISNHFSDGVYVVPDMICYGDSIKMTVRVDDIAIPFQDSDGNSILDSSNNQITATNCAVVAIKCKFGRL